MPIFVVQHHVASHDHDDFRLELDGVLKSWAIPKRVSRQLGLKRLAVPVEDHPLNYAHFEGTIPEGKYGAGSVRIWDTGTWEAEGNPATSLRQGKLVFTLQGAKLTGRWALIRLKRTPKSSARRASWLLMRLSRGVRADKAASDLHREEP